MCSKQGDTARLAPAAAGQRGVGAEPTHKKPRNPRRIQTEQTVYGVRKGSLRVLQAAAAESCRRAAKCHNDHGAPADCATQAWSARDEGIHLT